MKKRSKRICAWLLAIAMLFSMDGTAYAAQAGAELFADEAKGQTVAVDFSAATLPAEEAPQVSQSPDGEAGMVAVEPAMAQDDPAVSGGNAGNAAENAAGSDAGLSDLSEGDAGKSDVSSGDAADPAQSGTDVSVGDIAGWQGEFRLNPGVIMYGESGNNEQGNLDILFAPEWTINGEKLVLFDRQAEAGDYTVSYKFFTGELSEEQMTVRGAKELDGEDLSRIPAGTKVTAVATAHALTTDVEDAVAYAGFTVAKRKVVVRIQRNSAVTVDAKELPEGNQVVLSASEEAEFIHIEPVAGVQGLEASVFSAAEEQLAVSNAVEGNVVFDVSGIDETVDGYQTVPVELTFTPEFEQNFEVVGNIFGEIYTRKAHYYITFTAKNNGQTKTFTYEIPSTVRNQSVKAFLNSINKYGEVFPSMGGFVDETAGDCITTWGVHVDGSADMEDMWDYEDYEEYSPISPEDYVLNDDGKSHDYLFVAVLRKRLADGLYIQTIPSVYYDGRAHVVRGTYLKGSANKSRVNDVSLFIFNDDGTTLSCGTDYTVSYKNNKNATMKLKEDGTYESLLGEGDEKKRPTVVINGKGQYKGFSAEVYFDILPRNLGEYSNDSDGSAMAEISGLKYSYALKNGKLNAKISPKVTKSYSYYSDEVVCTLKAGKDYVSRLYRWNEYGEFWEQEENPDPNKISRGGDYLYTIWGIGNYCGAVYGQNSYPNEFDDGRESHNPNPAHSSYTNTYNMSSYQFYVSDEDAYWDIANAKVTVSKPTIKYDGSPHSAADFGLKVTIGNGADKRTLTEGVDYKLTFSDYRAYEYKNGSENYIRHQWYYASTTGANSPAQISVANKYKVKIEAMGDKFFGYQSVKDVRIKGIDLKSSYFQLSNKSYSSDKDKPLKSLDYTGNTTTLYYHLTQAGKKAGLTTSGSGAYAVGAYSNHANAAPGKYYMTLYAKGAGVDHEVEPSLYWTRNKASLQTAINKGWISFDLGQGVYNVKGAYPGSVNVNYTTAGGGSESWGKMSYNNQSGNVWVRVGSGTNTSTQMLTLTLSAKNHTKAGGEAYITMKASGLYTGSATVNASKDKFSYSIAAKEVYDDIPVLTPDSYMVLNGKRSSYLAYGVAREGDLMAQITDGNGSVRGVSLDKPQVVLYQTYYKNKNDLFNGRLSLAKLKTTQYRITAEMAGTNTRELKVSQSGHEYISGFKFGDDIYVEGNYSVYAKAVKIVGAKVRYNGKEYEFGSKSVVTLPFEGVQIRFDRNDNGVTGVIVEENGELKELSEDNFDVYYDVNTAAGKNTGSFTVILKRNNEDGTYQYGGKATFKFTIQDAAKVTL